MLYLIEILHQTTTRCQICFSSPRCILSKFYIKPQHLTLIGKNNLSCILSKFYIKPQLRDWLRYVCTVVSYRNSTSNHNNATMSGGSASLYLIEILHQTTTRAQLPPILLLLYLIEILHQTTTEHSSQERLFLLYLIEILHQTTTIERNALFISELYLIEILHQTTTAAPIWIRNRRLYLIEILHQTTTAKTRSAPSRCCILSKFYIKPQLYSRL